MKNPLRDEQFLKKLYEHNEREIYAKVVALNVYGEPVEEIQGKVTSGSINVDGNSAVRRTCSLSILAYDIKLTEYYWGIKTKFTLSIGLKNFIDSNYPSIIWFPQGMYIITSFNSSQSTNAFNISLSGKDKMCLLNGDMSGSIHANSTRFDIIESYDEVTDSRTETKIPIKDIIREMVHGYAGEPMHNIIINDLDDYGLELLEYRGTDPLYLLFQKNSDLIDGIRIDPTGTEFNGVVFKSLTTNNGLFDGDTGSEWTDFDTGKKYYIGKLENGDTAGYRLTELIYPDELIAKAGESITSVLDKIKDLLGDYEYFFDINGRFIFQKKKVYINTSWNNLRTGEDGAIYADAAAYQSPITWHFEGNTMLTSISNTPALNNLKNDFSVWGVRKSVSGADIPIHLRYAVDKKPTQYTSFDGKKYNISTDGKYNIIGSNIYCDYREIIYQMALDYRAHNREDNFISTLIANNPETCSRGRTGYEQYYIDMEGFWRQLYDPSKKDTEEYDKNGWHRNASDNPSVLNFWIDFLDNDSNISKFSASVIGDRAKVVNDNKIKSIYFKDTPLIIYCEKSEDRFKKAGYSYAQLGNIESLFTVSSQGKTAKEELDSLLYNYTYCAETISLNTIPIYTLQPNTHISVKDEENIDVNGEYVISRITIPLNYNGTMSISATKVPQRI